MPNLNTSSAIYIRYRPAWFKMGNHLPGAGHQWFILGSKLRRKDFPSVNDIGAQRLAGARRFAWWGRWWPAHFLMGVYMRNLLLAATAALSFAVPAAAIPAPPTTYKFSLTGAANFNWTLPASPTPNGSTSSGFTLDNVDVNGESSNLVFFNAANFGGFNLTRGSTNINTNGPSVFTGPTSAPTFSLGTFGMTSGMDNYDLTISAAGAVPEPASWAMLIAGFGLTGAAMRRRRTSVAAA